MALKGKKVFSSLRKGKRKQREEKSVKENEEDNNEVEVEENKAKKPKKVAKKTKDEEKKEESEEKGEENQKANNISELKWKKLVVDGNVTDSGSSGIMSLEEIDAKDFFAALNQSNLPPSFVSYKEEGEDHQMEEDSEEKKNEPKKKSKAKKEKKEVKEKLEDSQNLSKKTEKKKKEKKKETKKEEKIEEKKEEEEEKEEIDVTIWRDYLSNELLLKAISQLGFKEPTPIQKEALIAAIRDGKDIVGAAQTGSGKTLAFGLPMIQAIIARKLKEEEKEKEEDEEEEVVEEEGELGELITTVKNKKKENYLRGLILTPTRELAMQIYKHLISVAKYTNIKIVPIIGGIALPKQQRLLSGSPDIVVATPGRLWDLISQNMAPYISDIRSLEFLVIDEADRMIQPGSYQELTSILETLPITSKKTDESKNEFKRQTFVFSATLTTEQDELRKRSSKTTLDILLDKLSFQRKIEVINLSRKELLADTIQEMKLECMLEDKDVYLYYFLQCYTGKTLVFVNSIQCIHSLVSIFECLNVKIFPLHANMQQKQRLRNLERFTDNENSVLVATDVAARGLDIPNVDHVIHYHVPKHREVYIHRSGRTGRANKTGVSVAFVQPTEVVNFNVICQSLQKERRIVKKMIIDHSLIPEARERVNLARQISKLSDSQTSNKVSDSEFKKLAKEMEVELDTDLLNEQNDEVSRVKAHKDNTKKTALRAQLKTKIQRPLVSDFKTLKVDPKLKNVAQPQKIEETPLPFPLVRERYNPQKGKVPPKEKKNGGKRQKRK
eukprot:TRINITY_DN8308_c0_g1_i1.p1 TRINITY_DN8308_c0_g1~~TRINITY_DN8308_c0_g1_i1.p1  ORF type:complete len:782 (+),score=368.78 TRINITY_DN8308_c0_g1_i1:112-2457(+)